LVTVFASNNDSVENGGFLYDPATGTGINNLGQVVCATSNTADGTTIGLFVGTPRRL
jgi:hypothetical protein